MRKQYLLITLMLSAINAFGQASASFVSAIEIKEKYRIEYLAVSGDEKELLYTCPVSKEDGGSYVQIMQVDNLNLIKKYRVGNIGWGGIEAVTFSNDKNYVALSSGSGSLILINRKNDLITYKGIINGDIIRSLKFTNDSKEIFISTRDWIFKYNIESKKLIKLIATKWAVFSKSVDAVYLSENLNGNVFIGNTGKTKLNLAYNIQYDTTLNEYKPLEKTFSQDGLFFSVVFQKAPIYRTYLYNYSTNDNQILKKITIPYGGLQITKDNFIYTNNTNYILFLQKYDSKLKALNLSNSNTLDLMEINGGSYQYLCNSNSVIGINYKNAKTYIEKYALSKEFNTNNIQLLNLEWISPKLPNINTNAANLAINVCVSNPDNVKYKSVEYYLNGSKFNNRDFEIVSSSCISSFNKVIDLQEGQNTFEVVVLDNSGNEINREKRVINYTPKQVVTPIINPIPKVITEKRLALVVGNSNYNNGNNLPNPSNDADSLDIVLTALNFKVIKIKNQSKQQLESAIKNFAVQLKDYDVGLFFYAGHGMEFNGENYIIPTDAEKLDKSDVQYRCVSTSWLQEKMAEAGAYNKTNIVILDACRNNPFRSWRTFDDSKIWTPPSNIPTGTIIEYAASQGQKASDGYGSNGLFTSILLKHIKTRGLEIEKVFKRVRIDLKLKGGQDPVEINQLTNDFYFVK